MYLAMAMDGKNLDSDVSQRFEACKYLLLVETDDLSIKVIENKAELSAESLAEKIIAAACEGVITGLFDQPEAFDILADACITRYLGTGHSGKAALDLMKKRELKLIRNIEGTDQCDGDHHQHD